MFFAQVAAVQEAAFWLTVIRIATGLGAITAIATMFRYSWNRWRWKRFKRSAARWEEYVEVHPIEMEEEDWQVVVEQLLGDARFSPFEVQQLLATAVVTAKGVVARKLFI